MNRTQSILATFALVTCSLVPTLTHAKETVHQGTVELEPGSQVSVPKGYTLHKTFAFGTLPDGAKPEPIKVAPNGDQLFVLAKKGTYRMTDTANDQRFGWHPFVGATIKVKAARKGPPITVYPLRGLKR